MWVLPIDSAGAATADAHRLAFEDASFTATIATNLLFEAAGKLRLHYSSMVSPWLGLGLGLANPNPNPNPNTNPNPNQVSPRALREYAVTQPEYPHATLKVQPVPG